MSNFRIEFHPRDGGEDARLFAKDLATAVSKYAESKSGNNDIKLDTEGRTPVLSAISCL